MSYEEVSKAMGNWDDFYKLIEFKRNGKPDEAIKYIIDKTHCDEKIAREVYLGATRDLGDPNEPEPNIPKCPTCGSIDIERINPFEQGVSIYLLGMLSNEFNKTFKCNNCGYTW